MSADDERGTTDSLRSKSACRQALITSAKAKASQQTNVRSRLLLRRYYPVSIQFSIGSENRAPGVPNQSQGAALGTS
jgi:hypothetical protein